MRDLEKPGRSPVHAMNGMAATSHPLSTQTAIDVLKAGGNALDAAVAACAVQCVVEPESTGIGGDCFCLYSKGGSTDIIAYNGSGRAPAAASVEWFTEQGLAEIPRESPHSVVVPGAVDAWDRLIADHGTMPLAELLQPAIGFARDGYPISSRVHFDFALKEEMLSRDEHTARIFLRAGKAPQVGALHRQPDLAATLERIARNGRDEIYTGETAEDIVRTLQAHGGLHTMDDFATARGEYVDPISAEFRGHDVHQCPPNGQGVIALLLLNIMSGIEARHGGPITLERMHAEVEAGRLAYAARDAWLADPAMAEVPVDELLSAGYAESLRKAIDPARAQERELPLDLPRHESTVYITVVDRDRNACSLINTLFDNFGSGICTPTGVVLTNRAQGFSLNPDSPNRIEGGKRPLHTIIPGMVSKRDRVVMPYGVMGGQYQAFGHMQFLTRVFDYGMDIQEAQDAPRFMVDPFDQRLDVEQAVPEAVRGGLASLGHRVTKPAKPIGGSQAIWIDWDEGVLTGGSDPRKDGCAIGY
ncbi:MAG: gamma-glutamyltransferase [Paracoccaceae bacterium]|nr:gamma-glutamyltransferase [Paracoccaceae bacterium]